MRYKLYCLEFVRSDTALVRTQRRRNLGSLLNQHREKFEQIIFQYLKKLIYTSEIYMIFITLHWIKSVVFTFKFSSLLIFHLHANFFGRNVLMTPYCIPWLIKLPIKWATTRSHNVYVSAEKVCEQMKDVQVRGFLNTGGTYYPIVSN